MVGGHAILAIHPAALGALAAGRQVVLVSGTNGKTTTTKLLAAALASPAAGPEVVVTNLLGANMPTGLAAALAAGRPGAPAVLEVDEAWLGRVAAQVRPSVLVLLNLSRDQLDRNNEVRHVAQRWRQACREASGAVVVANADDPLVAWAATGAPRVTWVGAGLRWRNDATGCPECGGTIVFGPGVPGPGVPGPAFRPRRSRPRRCRPRRCRPRRGRGVGVPEVRVLTSPPGRLAGHQRGWRASGVRCR